MPGTNIPTIPTKLVTLAEASAWWHCHPCTIRRAIARGEVTGYRFGPRMLRVDPDELAGALRVIPTADRVGEAS